ncbi:hypothetical protein [Saliphagus sp. LR7]|uniref:hypothetical protein n=1 Tax=Saliphagus sp. LR7 TaxID=2282654 RepID=UPI000DF7C4DD|nr:hypothetical protein [Saliphagus sp. LR7]
MWGLWDEIHWHENAPLFRADWSPKPASDVSTDLVFGEWWIDRAGNADGVRWYTADATLGTYDLAARANGRTASKLPRPTRGFAAR